MIENVYFGMEQMINRWLKTEWAAQGHYLTGGFDRSLSTKLTKTSRVATLSGYAIKYAIVVNQGIEPDGVSDKMLPGLVNYFLLRGYGQQEAARIAFATLHVWKREGMSTQASKRFSATGARQNFIESAFVAHDAELNTYMSTKLDLEIDEQYRSISKSEIV